MERSLLLLLFLAAFTVTAVQAQAPVQTANIRLNQVGFYPEMQKVAVVVDPAQSLTHFHVVTSNLSDTVFTAPLSTARTWIPSNETVRLADFSGLTAPGNYTVVVPGVGKSYNFSIEERVFEDLARASVKSYYFMRASTALTPAYASVWSRPAGHPDQNVLVHASAASAGRPAGTVIASPKGWYDAGDFNKYIVNSGITTGTLLALYEHFPAYFDALELDIPETGNAIPDLLDEVLWNLRWMLTMQDPVDGGVYHKLTNPNFDGMVMPHAATTPRYVVKKSTPAALDFAAVTAMAARIFAAFPEALPGLSDSLLTASQEAWRWARRNPSVFYSQAQVNASFDPDIHTGEYGDGSATDEFRWAATELYITTKADSFAAAYNLAAVSSYDVPGWPNVSTMGVYSLLHHYEDLTPAVNIITVEGTFLELANQLLQRQRGSPFGIVMGSSVNQFNWGSNSLAANQGMALIQAFRMTQDTLYLDAALSNLDYILGRNGTNHSYVTGAGDNPPLNPHHRQSAADNVRNPVPGFLVGGPNVNQEDRSESCVYQSILPAKSFIDQTCSYASNEVAINWNAPFAYLAGALEAILSPTGLPTGTEEDGDVGSNRSMALSVYPNPATGITSVSYSLREPGPATLAVYDVLGRQVALLLNNQSAAAERNRVSFDASGLPSGVYFVRLISEHEATSTSLVVTR